MSDPFIAKPFKAAPNLSKLTLQDATSACEKVWGEFFNRLESYSNDAEPIDLAIWEIQALSCRVMCRPGSSYRDENDPARDAPGMIFFLATALEKEMRRIFLAIHSDNGLPEKEGERQLGTLEVKFFDLISEAVLNAFNSKAIQKRFSACKLAQKQFSIFGTPNDEGLDSSKLILIWKNKQGLTAEQVRQQAILLSRGSKNKKAVKKSPAKLQAEGRAKKGVKAPVAKKKASPKTSSKKSAKGKVAKRTRTTVKGKKKPKK